MFSPIVRSAQRISTRTLAQSSSNLASLQIADAKCNVKHSEHPTSLTHNQKMSSASQFASSVAVESSFEPSIMKNRLALPNLLVDTNDEEAVQETSQVDVYHQFQSQPDKVLKSMKLTGSQEKALKKFVIAEQTLNKDNLHNKTAIKWMNAIKFPLLDTVRSRASSFIDSETCRSFISKIGDISDPSTVVVIGNPGAGILSHQFMKKGAKQLVLFEQNSYIRSHLEKIHKNQPVYVAPHSLFSLGENNEHALINLLESEKYNRIKIVQPLSNPTIAKSILTNYTTGIIPFDNKHVELYFVVEKAYGEKLVEMEMVDPLRKLTKSITAWRTFVKSELVCTIAADAFFPSFAPLGFGVHPRKKRADKAVVLRCTFRPISCRGRTLSSTERNLYSMFIRHVMSTSTAKVINSLEKWIPGIGLRLIREGIPLFTCFNQLSSDEFERIFFIFLEMAPEGHSAWQLLSSQNNNSMDWLREFDATAR
ncbi:uncharacterized protein LOC124204333 [Daphnia pulex]|uniref:uncharacterized protein LOC124204333 n=1 Tax=Daphnia pulex TaxID=6669 RepID=UPI001EDEF9AC|nr:uncharacterized protein LOC124204333 [Daphnia pulex]